MISECQIIKVHLFKIDIKVIEMEIGLVQHIMLRCAQDFCKVAFGNQLFTTFLHNLFRKNYLFNSAKVGYFLKYPNL